MKRIAVVGGGLTGLVVAYRLGAAGHRVELFEATPRLGGQLHTLHEHGYTVELGAEGFVARSEAVPKLAADLGMLAHAADDPQQLLGQTAHTSYRYEDGTLHAFAAGEAGVALNFQVDERARGAGLRTFVGGMQILTDTLAATMQASAHLGVAPSLDALRADFDEVVTTTPALLGEPLGSALSSVTVSLAYPAAAVEHPLDGTGFVVTEPFEGFRACTFTTSKFAHRAPPGFVSLRVFFRPTAEELLTSVDWQARAERVLGQVLPIRAPAVHAWVSRWSEALPVYDDARRAAVRAVEARGVHVAGSSFHGSGIDAAVRSAEAVAARLA